MSPKRIIFIRPGETDWNRAGKQQGWVASPLNALGVQQAEKLGHLLPLIGVGAVYASDLKRAMQTAELLAQKLGLKPVFDERLRERSVGVWQGLTMEEIRDWYPDEFWALLTDVDGYRIPGGESRLDVQQRMTAALKDILDNASCETVAVISHTTAIKMAIRSLVPGMDVHLTELTNSSVTTLELDEAGTWRAVAVDDVLHLEGLETASVKEPEDAR